MTDRLYTLFAEELDIPVEDLTDASSPESIAAWDSVAAMNLVALIEETFATQLSTRDIMTMQTIGMAREVLESKGVEI